MQRWSLYWIYALKAKVRFSTLIILQMLCNLYRDITQLSIIGITIRRGLSLSQIIGSDLKIPHSKIPSNLSYKSHRIPKVKCFSSRLEVVFAHSIEVWS